MTSFVHLEYSKQHPGVERAESAISAAQQLSRSFTGTRGLATLLLSAIAAAVMVVAYQVMDSVAEGHLLVLWVGVWALAFVFLAGFAGPARQLTLQAKSALDDWSKGIAVAKADQRLWAAAKHDPRVMADLQCAIARNEEVLVSQVPPAPSFGAATPAQLQAIETRTARLGGAELRAYKRHYI